MNIVMFKFNNNKKRFFSNFKKSKNEDTREKNINIDNNVLIQNYYRFFWRVKNKLNKRILNMKPVDRAVFIRKYKHKYDFSEVLSMLEKKVSKNLMLHKKLTSKRYKMLLEYKRSKLDNINNYPKWDLHDEIWDKKFSNVTYSTNWHVKKYYLLKKVICYFYGYIKYKMLKKVFLKTKHKKNRVLSFFLYFETLLITVLFRLGFVLNFLQGKQFIRHGFILLNNKKIIYRWHKVKKNDIITYNIKKYNKFIYSDSILSRMLIKNFMYKKTLFPHLWVNRMQPMGIILYRPDNYYKVLLNQYPKLFFNSYRDEDLYKKKLGNFEYNKILLKEKSLENEVIKSKSKKKIGLSLFDKTFMSIEKIVNKHRLPPQNVKLVLAFMIKQ